MRQEGREPTSPSPGYINTLSFFKSIHYTLEKTLLLRMGRRASWQMFRHEAVINYEWDQIDRNRNDFYWKSIVDVIKVIVIETRFQPPLRPSVYCLRFAIEM